MTKIIKKFGEPFSPYGIQFWSNDLAAVVSVQNYIAGISPELEKRGISHTVRLRDGDGEDYCNMSFGAALEAMRNGKAVRLPHWQPDVRIMMQAPDEHSKMTHAYLYVRSRFGCVPWIPTQVELLSMDWQVSKHVE